MTQNSEKHIDICGEVYYDVEGIIDSFYTGTFSNKIKSKDAKDINQFNKMLKFFSQSEEYVNNSLSLYDNNLTREEYDSIHNKWNIPEQYLNMDIETYILEKANNQEEKDRLIYELKIYKERDFYDLLKAMVYLHDVFVDNDIIIGVGRGSSVASYVLYKIGIHKIDTLKYDIDFSEFLD